MYIFAEPREINDMTETSIDQVTGLVIHAVFSLADKDIEEVRQTDDTNITESEREISRSKVIEEVRPADDTVLLNRNRK